MTFCVVYRDEQTLAVANANDARVGVTVERASDATFWDFHDACTHGHELAVRLRISFKEGGSFYG